MSTIYLYSKKIELIVLVNESEVALSEFSTKWKYFQTSSENFIVKFNGKAVEYSLSTSENYAIYREQLIKLEPYPNRLLLATDLDKTIFHNTQEGLEAYSRFIHYWIAHFEFNGSKLVYNTGRSLAEYLPDIEHFYEPDLLITAISNFIYKFDQNGNAVLQESFHLFVEDFADSEWDSKLFCEILFEKFPCLREYIQAADPYNIFFLAPKEAVEGILKEFILFVRNNENIKINNRCFKGKTIVSTQGTADKIYLEVLPKFGGKGLGIKFAQYIFGFTTSETLIAGDSLNDKDSFKSGHQGVIVKNAEELLLAWYNKRERPNIILSNLKYADAVIDFITTESRRSGKLSTIFIYPALPPFLVNNTQLTLPRFKEKWSVFETDLLDFSISNPEVKTYTLQHPGRYAIYNNTLIPISNNLSRVLLVTDLDNTIFNSSPEGLAYYSNFIEFWIRHFEFNGSFLVYNSGRDYKSLLEDIHLLFLGDLHQLCLGNFAYILNRNLELIPDTGFGILKDNSGEKHDWDSQLLFDALKEKFNLTNEHLKVLYDTYFLLYVPKQITDENLPNIKKFIKNYENHEIGGRVFHGKVRMLSLGLEDFRYVEIIPLFLGKNLGVRFAQKKFSFGDENTYAAGDSLNDKDALKLPVNGIVMCNGEETLINWFRKKHRKNLTVTSEKYAFGLQTELQKALYFYPRIN